MADPTSTDADKYKVIFENERVRVLEYRDEPGQVTKPHVTGPLSKVRLDQDDLAGQIRAYYAARGWNDQGVPLPETLARLGVADYV